MKKFVPVIIVALVLLLVLIVVVGRKSDGVSKKMKPGAATPSAIAVEKKKKTASLLQEAKSAYDAKNYPQAISKSQEVLSKVDSTSQEAKNLLQISQIRMMEEAKPPVVVQKTPPVAVKTPVTNKAK